MDVGYCRASKRERQQLSPPDPPSSLRSGQQETLARRTRQDLLCRLWIYHYLGAQTSSTRETYLRKAQGLRNEQRRETHPIRNRFRVRSENSGAQQVSERVLPKRSRVGLGNLGIVQQSTRNSRGMELKLTMLAYCCAVYTCVLSIAV